MREWERYCFASEPHLEALSPLPKTFRYLPVDSMYSPNVPEHSTAAVAAQPNALHIDRLAVSTLTISDTYTNPSSQFALSFSSSEMLGSFALLPFAWGSKLDWDSLARTIASNRQVAQIRQPDLSRLNAMFYTQCEAPLTIATTTKSLVLRHLVSSLVNGIDYTDIYRQLTLLPKQVVVACFRSLHEETRIVLRQRLRTAAAKDDDCVVVEALLQLEEHLCGSTLRADTEVLPILDRLKTCRQPIAVAIVHYASRVNRSQDLVLNQFLEVVSTLKPTDIYRLDIPKLMCIFVKAGATLTHPCFFLHTLTPVELQKLIDLGERDILTWIQDGLLSSAVTDAAKRRSEPSSYSVPKWILSSLKKSYNQKSSLHLWTDEVAHVAYIALVAAFQAGLEASCTWAVEAIYDTCQQLGNAAYCPGVDPHVNSTVMQACTDRDWTKAIQAVLMTKAAPISRQSSWDENSLDEVSKIFEEAMLAEDVQTMEELLDEDPDPFDWAMDSTDSDCDAIAALAAVYAGPEGILTLLQYQRVGAMSFLLCQYSHWTEILQHPFQASAFDGLEDFLYRRGYHKDCRRFPCCLSISRPLSHQIVLRALSYHAIYTSDAALIDWLHNHGLATTNMVVERDREFTVSELWSHPCQNDKFLKPSYLHDDYMSVLPSLLNVATMQPHDPRIFRHLLAQQLAYRDSGALLDAVESKPEPNIVRLLLSAHHYGAAVSRTQFGSAALRITIRRKNYDLMRVLAPETDIHGLEPTDSDDVCLDCLDPLGEAILQKDRTAVKIMLENGGDPNTVVAFQSLQEHTSRSASNSVLLRMTPLLVAIDVGDYDMVSFLVNNGADVNRGFRLGILRTPLQRASEIGDFEMVQYLILEGATVDAAPAYGGGTALQLAAMSGHLGIAALLVQNGANVNYPPARGPGRTAFEAAAEWCRPDMMYLLVQLGAKLDMEVGEEVEERLERQGTAGRKFYGVTQWRTELKWRTQYERALHFAEERKEYASKAIAEKIGVQFGVHIDDGFFEIATLQRSFEELVDHRTWIE